MGRTARARSTRSSNRANFWLMDSTLIVKTGTTLPSISTRRGDFEDWIRVRMGVELACLTVASVFEDAELPRPDQFARIVITGSSAMVSHRELWSERTAAWLRDAVNCETPLLGICYGHQLLAHALGGRVGANPRGREIGTIDVQLEKCAARDPLLAGFPGSVCVNVSHLEAVLELPGDAVRLGASENDPNAAFSIGSTAWGVQFHPEFDADVMRGYIEGRREQLCAEGIDADERLGQVEECPDGTELLGRFARLRRGSL
jgi:GMP synthase (glutamine-hydrolysing)